MFKFFYFLFSKIQKVCYNGCVLLRKRVYILKLEGVDFMEWVGFPGLGVDRLEISSQITIFGLNIYWYGVIIAIGMSLAIIYAFFSAKKFGINRNNMIDVIVIGIICGMVGARLYYVIFSLDSFSGNWLKIFDLRTGGLAIYGGVIFAFLGGYFGCKLKKVKFLPMADVAAIGFLLGQGIGRWGNFFNIEAYGTKTDLPWGMTSSAIPFDIQPVHPTFLYESIWCILGFIAFNFFLKYRKFDGQITLMYMVWYGFERFFVEGLRTDSLWLIPDVIRVSQLISLILFVFAVSTLLYMFLVYMKKHPDKEYLYVNSAKFEKSCCEKNKI